MKTIIFQRTLTTETLHDDDFFTLLIIINTHTLIFFWSLEISIAQWEVRVTQPLPLSTLLTREGFKEKSRKDKWGLKFLIIFS